MNKIELCGDLYYFEFLHEHPYRIKNKFFQGFTRCAIYKVGYSEPIPGIKADEQVSTGIARCHEKDLFVKETGRKVSLAKAISNLPFPTTPQERSRFWAAYFWRVPGNKIEVVCER